jgi:hypothetical protein
MATRNDRPDAVVRKIESTLKRYYVPDHPKAQIKVYRYNPGSVRVRIIDPDFAGQSLTDRDSGVWDLMEKRLTEDEYGEVNLLLLLAPGEEKTSLMNLEFDNPNPSRL